MGLQESDWLHIFESTRAITETLQLSELLTRVMTVAKEVMKAEASSLLLLDPVTDELYFDVALGEKGEALQRIRLKKGEGIAGWVAQQQKPTVVNDVANDPRWTQKGDKASKFETKAILAVPMIARERLIGVMEAINRIDGEPFTQSDLRVLEILSAQAAVAIENARLFESIRQEKEKMSTILTEMSEGAVLLDGKGSVLLANPAAVALLGGSPEGKSWEQVTSAFEMKPAWQDLVTTLGGAGGIEFSRKGAPPLILEGVVNQICNDRGQVSGFMAVFRDVTEERREAQLKKSFLALVSHKLKTPLVAIRGFVPMLLEKPEELSGFQKTALETIDRNSHLLTTLVEKITWFAVVEADTLELTRKPYPLRELVDMALADLASILSGRKVDMEQDKSIDQVPPVWVDKIWMKEVLRNVIENAVKFNAGDKPQVKISAVKAGDTVTVHVTDNGAGIPSEERSKIFQKFYQIESGFTGQVQGMGLGLALVKRVIEAHGGAVSVESKMGQGSTFLLRLPTPPHAAL